MKMFGRLVQLADGRVLYRPGAYRRALIVPAVPEVARIEVARIGAARIGAEAQAAELIALGPASFGFDSGFDPDSARDFEQAAPTPARAFETQKASWTAPLRGPFRPEPE